MARDEASIPYAAYHIKASIDVRAIWRTIFEMNDSYRDVEVAGANRMIAAGLSEKD